MHTTKHNVCTTVLRARGRVVVIASRKPARIKRIAAGCVVVLWRSADTHWSVVVDAFAVEGRHAPRTLVPAPKRIHHLQADELDLAFAVVELADRKQRVDFHHITPHGHWKMKVHSGKVSMRIFSLSGPSFEDMRGT
mmetsp:Transcript_36620/g.56822  ORF Transcript_36620/g.56822 Transcript_36620/m.56822 type:complete len:137 (+) Transcript_36620:107-517(+)